MKKQSMFLRAYQVVFGIVLATFIGGLVQMMLLIQSVSVSSDGGQWLWWFAAMQIEPFAVFIVLWVGTTGELWKRMYLASALGIAAVFAGSAFSTLVSYFVWPLVFSHFSDVSSMYILNLMSIVPQLIFAVAYAVFLRRQHHAKNANSLVYSTVAVSAAALFLTYVVQTLVQVMGQYPYNQNLSAYVISFVSMAGIALFVAVLFLAEKHRKEKKPLRRAIFIGAMSVLAVYAIMYLLSLLPHPQTVQWVEAAVVALGSVGVFFLLRWLYRVLRVLE